MLYLLGVGVFFVGRYQLLSIIALLLLQKPHLLCQLLIHSLLVLELLLDLLKTAAFALDDGLVQQVEFLLSLFEFLACLDNLRVLESDLRLCLLPHFDHRLLLPNIEVLQSPDYRLVIALVLRLLGTAQSLSSGGASSPAC